MRRLFLGLPFLGALLAVPPAQAQDTVIVTVGGELSAPLFEEFRVPILVDLRKSPGTKLGSYTIRLSWNSSILSFYDTREGAFAEHRARTDSAYGFGVLWLTGVSPGGDDSVVHVADVVFTVDSADATTISIQATELSAAGTLADLMTTTTVVNQAGSFCPALGRWGDLDDDGLANSRDALAILSDVVDVPVDPAFNLALGDVDGDAKVNSRDALILLSYAVGLPIPGQRVLLVAGGLCTSGTLPAVVVVPDTADLVPGQLVRLLAFARDGSGRLTAVSRLAWDVVDRTVALVDNEGNLLAREPGTTTVRAAIGPAAWVEAPVIVRARRQVWYADAARATQTPVQLGTMQWPFANPGSAFGLVSEGDTIRVAPGVYDFTQGYEYVRAGITILGDTLADGTRPLLRATPGSNSYAMYWYPGGTRAVVRNLVIEGFYYGILSDGLRNLSVENIRIVERGTGYGYGVLLYQTMDTLRVLRSELVGDSAQFSYYGIYVGDGIDYAEVHDSKFRFWGYGGFYGYDVDSLDVRRSDFADNGSYGIYVYRDDLPTVSATISRSTFRNANSGLYVYGARTVALDHNVFDGSSGDVIDVEAPYVSPGNPVAGTRLVLQGDSIRQRASGYYWLDTEQFDTILVDSVVVQSRPDTATYHYGYFEANYARVSNSRFHDLYSGIAIYFFGRRLVVDNSEFRGCNVCTWANGDAIEAYDLGTTGSVGPAVSVSNSAFSKQFRAIYVDGRGSQGGPVTIANNTVDSVSYGFDVYADSATLSDNVLSRIQYRGIYVEPSNVNNPYSEARVLRNQISCHPLVATSGYGIQAYYAAVRSELNGVRNCQYGLYAYQYYLYPMVSVVSRGDTVFPRATTYYNVGIRMDQRVRPTIVGARIVGGYFGIDVTPYDTGSVRIDSSAVSGAGQAGIQLYYIGGPAVGVRNNIAANLLDGIYNVGGSGLRSFTLGKFKSGAMGNGRWAVNSATAFDATQNWWGSANGAGGPFGSGLQDADSVSSAAVGDTLHLLFEPGDVPPLAPPLGTVVARSPAAARSAPVAAPLASPRPTVDPEAARAAREERVRQRQAARVADRDREMQAAAERRRVMEEDRARRERERAEGAKAVRRPQ